MLGVLLDLTGHYCAILERQTGMPNVTPARISSTGRPLTTLYSFPFLFS